MKIRKAVMEDVKEFNKLAEYCFGDPYEVVPLYEELFDPEITTVVEEDGKLAGGYVVYPFDITYGTSTAKMGGVSCVTMDVHARYKGYAKKMLVHMINEMHKEGMAFSALGAFNFQFYRKLGWEVAYDKYVMELEIEQLKDFLASEYTVKKHYDIPIDKVIKLQTEYAKKYSGYIPRTKDYWIEYEKHYKKHKNLFGTATLDNEVKGYVIYRIEPGEKIIIREIVYSDNDALKALLGFIYRHNAQIMKVVFEVPTDFPIRMMVKDQHKVEVKLKTAMMNRVVDVKKAFELGDYPNVGEYSITLKVNDNHAEWNDGIWHLYLSQGSITAERGSEDDTFDAQINITELSSMLIGYSSGAKLLELEKIETSSDEAIAFIKNVFLGKVTYMNNQF